MSTNENDVAIQQYTNIVLTSIFEENELVHQYFQKCLVKNLYMSMNHCQA